MIKDIKNRNCGIDGIGLMVTTSIQFDEYENLRDNIKRYAEIGIIVHLIDINVLGVDSDEHYGIFDEE